VILARLSDTANRLAEVTATHAAELDQVSDDQARADQAQAQADEAVQRAQAGAEAEQALATERRAAARKAA
jgi:hypothetical protein